MFSPRRIYSTLLAIVFSLPASAVFADQQAIAVVEKMISAVDKVNVLMYTQKKWERIDGELKFGSGLFKIQVSPFKVYMKQYAPREGTEVIYRAGWNDNEAKVNAGRFIPNLNLDVHGSRMRKDQHHAIVNAGFKVVADISRKLLNKHGAKAPSLAKYHGKINWNERSCHKIEVENPNWGWTRYTVKSGENLISIAKRKGLCEHMIMEGNRDIDDYFDVSAGQTIRIPTDYAKRIVMYIDAETHMPIRTVAYDDKGLYERYEFSNVLVNPSLPANSWDPENDAYGF